jgi:hypothetical protein
MTEHSFARAGMLQAEDVPELVRDQHRGLVAVTVALVEGGLGAAALDVAEVREPGLRLTAVLAEDQLRLPAVGDLLGSSGSRRRR